MRPIALAMACSTPLAIGGLVYVAYEQPTEPVRRSVQELSLANTPMSEPAPARTMAMPSIVAHPASAPPGIAQGETAAPLQVSVPKIAYSYRFGFTLPSANIARTQAAHIALCDRLGTVRCQLLSMRSGIGDGEVASARLKLRVASGIARAFGGDLERAVGHFDGRAASRSIAADDVSKDVSDTEARLRQRELLVARLTEVLRTRRGSVAELVEAERSVAAAQEEIDQARGWLTELQGRLAMSTIDVDYTALAVPPAPPAPLGLGDTITASFRTFATGMAGLLTAFFFSLPWAALLAVLWLAWCRLRPTWRRMMDDDAEATITAA